MKDMSNPQSVISLWISCWMFQRPRFLQDYEVSEVQIWKASSQISFDMSYASKTHICRQNLFRSGINWNQVIFSDEKMFTVHGSNCYYAWLNRNMSRRRVRQVVRSSGLMVWAMVMPNGLQLYQIMKGRQKSENYIRILENNEMPIIKLNYKDEFTFQQDDCPIHVSRKCQEFFW